MKILHIISSDGGGISSFVKNIVNENNNLHQHTVMSFGEYGSKFKELEIAKQVRLINMPRPKIVGMRNFLKFLNEFFKENKFDLIESHIQGIHAIPFKFYAKKNKNGKFAIHSHQTDFVFGREKSFKEKIIYKTNPLINNSLANVKIACGEAAAEYAFASTKNVYIIRNSVDVSKFITETKPDYKANQIRIGHVGRHSSAKNLDFLIALMEAFKLDNLPYRVDLYSYGEGELTEDFRTKINERSLTESIHLEGRKDDIYNYVKDMDVIVLPSFSEGLPTVAIEAQAARVPIIISDRVTHEVDLQVGLVKYLPIEPPLKAVEQWKLAIVEYKEDQEKMDITNTELLKLLDAQGFTTGAMIKNYNNMLGDVFNS